MDRRSFLKSSGFIASSFIISQSCSIASANGLDYILEESDSFVNEKLRTPVTRKADIIVCGGGPSGFGAAVEAARQGAKVILIEHEGYLGGTWTAGHLGVMLDHKNKSGILLELKEELEKRNWRANNVPTDHLFMFDSEKMKLLLEEICEREGIELLLYTTVCASITKKGRITHVITESKSGREAIAGGVFIDATGDGDLAALSGCTFDWGDENGNAQPMSMLALVTGLDFDEVQDCLQWAGYSNRKAKKNLAAEIRKGGYEPTYKMPCLFFLRENVFALMAVHQYGFKSWNRDDITKASILGRRDAHALVDALRSVGGRWQNMQIVSTANHIGCREGRRIHGLYTVTEDDLIIGKRHDDAACEVTFGVDVHPVEEVHDGTGTSYQRGIKSKPYDIPVRAMIPKDRKGLLVTGRCISGDFIAHSSYRVNANSVTLGQSAGYVAARAIKEGKEFTDIPFNYRTLLANTQPLL